MTVAVLAIVFLGALGVVTAAFVGVLKSLVRSHARERDLLINQLLHSVGRDWQPAPAEEHRRASRAEARGFTPPSWTATPEQLPVE
jgi:hypothetical protein